MCLNPRLIHRHNAAIWTEASGHVSFLLVTSLRRLASLYCHPVISLSVYGPRGEAIEESVESSEGRERLAAEDLERSFGFNVDERRFRINAFIEGAPAWSELAWVGKKLQIGKTLLQILKPIGRCPNIDVDADSGERKDEIFPRLKEKYGHSFTGLRADIIKGGTVRVGDEWELLD